MKRKITPFIVSAFMAMGIVAVGQNATQGKFVPGNTAADLSITKISENHQITASLMMGKMDDKKAMSVLLKNNSNVTKTIVCTVKDKSGNVITTATVTINAGETITAHNCQKPTTVLAFTVSDEKTPTDYQIEIIQK